MIANFPQCIQSIFHYLLFPLLLLIDLSFLFLSPSTCCFFAGNPFSLQRVWQLCVDPWIQVCCTQAEQRLVEVSSCVRPSRPCRNLNFSGKGTKYYHPAKAARSHRWIVFWDCRHLLDLHPHQPTPSPHQEQL